MRLAATDVLPTRFANAAAAVARRHLFADLDAGLAARLARGDVLVVEEHTGTMDDARAAFTALALAGVTTLVARAFGAGIESAALASGIVPVTLDAPAFIHTGDRVRVDLDAAKIVNLSSGDRAAIRNLGDERRAALRTLFTERGRT
jgi:3-isopropylmalate dehydratase small subunit